MIDALLNLAALLASADMSAAALAERLGTQAVDLRGNILVQQPSIAGVRNASVVRSVHGDAPSLITLRLERPLALRDLEAVFGVPNVVAAEHRGQFSSAVFNVPQPDLPFSVALIGAIENGATTEITLRRDTRLG